MHLYLASYVGIGTALNPFRPRGIEQPGFGAIDLRPDSRVAAGFVLVSVPVRDDLIGRYLGDALDERSQAVTQELESSLSLTFQTATTPRQMIAELLMVQARTDGTRWKPLQAERDGRFRIWLGEKTPLYESSPAIRGGTTLTESFNKADSSTLGPDQTWTEVNGDSSVVSNEVNSVTNDGSYGSSARAEADLASADHYCQMAVTAIGSVSGIGPCVRFHAAADTFYQAEAQVIVTQQLVMRKNVSASFTDLRSDAHTWSLPETVKIDVNGSTLKHYIGGTQVGSNVTDTDITGHLRCGLRGYSTGGNTVKGDNWACADLAASANAFQHAVLAGVRVGVMRGVL